MAQSDHERALALIQDLTSIADTVQDAILSQILAQNSDTEYLRHILGQAGLPFIESPHVQPDTFKRIAPLTCYEDIFPYIQHIADGDKSPILTNLPVTELLKSSGTSSGMQKMFPAIEADSERQKLLFIAASSMMHRKVEGMDQGKIALFQFVDPRRPTAGFVEECCHARTGSLNETEVFDTSSRKAVEKRIKCPNPALAMKIEEECCRQPLWQGILRRLWPGAKCVQCATTGSMEQYIPVLEFVSGGLPLISTRYAATECLFGINMNPLCSPYQVSYTFLPNMAYFEFLPLDGGADQTDHAEITTFVAGLYRYRIGDRVQVTGFHNKAPQFRLVGCRNVVLSIGIDKTDDATLHQAVCMAKDKHLEATSSCQLVDYTSYTDISTMPGHYVLFWEVEGPSVELSLDSSVMEACCNTTEDCFDIIYKKGKGSWIGPLEIRVVKQGSFQALMEYTNAVEGGRCIGQYKTPHVVKGVPLLELLNSSVSHSFFASQ
ncbi:hypothetical protein GOP47_0014784 [Adiantum capillus-veneris]|uniref:Uncharacterized protein n=1 Tax=Adiantum capillus-veneris TaxID=13818 RepID=A0A9D4UMW3_ADICA|nr:hypothetical protein GOP47_0014784 [Adiantum capillus-veneris]